MSEGIIIRVGLDGSKVTDSLKALKATVAASTSQMKAEMQIFKNAGDELGSLSAKHDGLTRTIKAQDIQIQKLVESYDKAKEKANGNTEATMKYANQINSARAKQESFKKQLQDTEIAMNDFKRGTNGIRDSLSLATRETNAMIDKLTAQGKSLRANKQEYIGLSSQMKERTRLIDAEKAKLQELIAFKGEDNAATRNQRIAVLELEATQAQAITRYKVLNKSVGSSSAISLAFRDNIGKLKNSLNSIGDKLTNAGQSMTMATLGLGAAFVYGAKQSAEFQNKMIEIKSLLQTGGESAKSASAGVKQMSSDAKKYSSEYGVSIHNIADGYEELVKRGYSSQQSLGAMKSLLQASKASGDDFNEVVHVSTSTLEQFGLKTNSTKGMLENTKRVTNALAYAADLTSTNFHDAGKAMEYVGGISHQAGWSVETTAAAIGLLSNKGLEADKAGTGLRKMITSLISPTKNARAALKEMGMSITDKNGDLKSLPTILDEMQSKLAKFKPKQKVDLIHAIFGQTGMEAANDLISSGGKALQELADKAKKAEKTNYTQSLSSKMMQSAQNQMNRFKESLRNLSIEFSNDLLPTITSVVKKLTGLISGFDKLSPSTKKVIAYAGLGAAAFAPFAIALGSVFKAVSVLIPVLTFLAANPIGLTITAIAALTAGVIYSYTHFKTFRTIVNDVGDYCKKIFVQMWADIKDNFKTSINFLGSVLKYFGDLFTGKWGNLFSDVKSITSDSFKLVGSIFKGLFDSLNNLTGGMLGKMLDKWTGFKSGLAVVVNDVVKGINTVLKWMSLPTIPYWNPSSSQSNVSGSKQGIAASGGASMLANARGTNFFLGGQTLVGEEGFELAYHPQKGYAQIIGGNGPQIYNGERGLKILNHADSKKVVNGGLGAGQVLPGFASGNSSISDFIGWITNPIGNIKNMFSKVSSFGSDIGGLGKGILTFLQNGVGKWIKDKIGSLGSISGTKVSGTVSNWIQQGMKIAGVSGANWFNGLSTIAMKESSGNPNAINLWDSNAKAGHPSAGLMQMIQSTFLAHAIKGHTSWMNPIDQVASDIGYILSRYGDISNVPGLRALSKGKGYVGYAMGTKRHFGGPAILGDGGQEEPYLTPQGKFGISPKVPTLFNLPAGTKVWPSVKKMQEDVPFFASGTSDEEWVKGYYRNGKWVKGYWRKKPASHSTSSSHTTSSHSTSSHSSSSHPSAESAATTALRQHIANLTTDYRIGAISLKTYISDLDKLKNAKGSTDATRNTIKNDIYSAQRSASSSRAAAERKAATAESKKVSDMISTVITDYRAGKINAKTEKAKLDAIQKNHTLSTAQRNSIVSAIASAAKATQAKLNSFNNGIKSAATTYYNSVKSITDNLKSTIASNKSNVYGAYGLYDSIQKNVMPSGTNLTDNLMQQDQRFGQFNSVIGRLRSRKGMSSALVDEIEAMGPQNLEQASAIAGMNQSALVNYVNLWKKKNNISNTIATDMSHNDIASAKSQIDVATKKFQTDLKANASKYYQSGFSIGKYTVSGIVSGFDAMGGTLKSATTNIGHTLITTIKKVLGIHSPSTETKTIAGFTIDGLTLGLANNAHKVIKASKAIAGHITRNIVPVTNTDAINGLYKVVSTPNSGANHVQPKGNTPDNATLERLLEAQLQQNQLMNTLINAWGNAVIMMDKTSVGKMITDVVTAEQAKKTSRSNMVMGVRTT